MSLSKRFEKMLMESKERKLPPRQDVHECRRWTRAEIEFIKNNYNLSDEEIAKKLGRTPKAVAERRRLIGILRINVWTDEELKLLEEYVKQGLTDREIAERLGRTPDAIRVKRLRMGLKGNRKPRRGRRSCDWTEEEDEQLRKLVADGLTDEQIARKLGKTKIAVRNRRLRLGLYKRKNRG